MLVLATFWATVALALVSPGPNFAVMLSTALRYGRGAAWKTAIGIAIGEAVWGYGAIFGVAPLAAAHPWIAAGLKYGGGAYLVYMGVMALRAALRPAPDQ